MSVYKRGDVWWYKFRFGGQVIRESSKSESKTVARDAERTRRRELEEKWNRVERRSLPPRFDQAAAAWFEAVKPHLGERTRDIYDVAIRCHLAPALGRLLLCDIEPRAIAKYQAKRKAEGAAPRTLNKELQVLRQILKRHKLWANLQGDVKFERETENVGQALTRAKESRLLANCAPNPLLHTVVILALNTALRRDEIRTLRWSQIDLFKRTLTVGRSKTEGGTGRVIPLNSDAYNSLVRWAELFPKAEPQHYVFPACESARIDLAKPCAERIDPTQPIRSWRTAWRRVTRASEAPALRFHDLRHTCITKLAEGQASEQTIMSIAGHLSRRMVEHYSHIRMEAKRAALDAIATPVFEVGGAQNWAQLPEQEPATAGKSLN